MVDPREKRAAVAHLRQVHGASDERRACGLVGLPRSTQRYQCKAKPADGLREQVAKLAAERPRFGYRRITALLQQQGMKVWHGRVHRITKELRLQVPRRKRKRLLGALSDAPDKAHARRHVYQARDTDPARMGAVLAYIAQLYAVEKRARRCGIAGEPLRLLREQASRPVLEQLHAYLLQIREDLLPKSEAGQAVTYLLKNWIALTRYLEDGDLCIDNNHTERSLRGIAVGRNNWVFFGSDRGGKTMAVLRSFIASCELIKVDPFEWFHDVLSRVASHSIQKLDELLPHRWAAAARP